MKSISLALSIILIVPSFLFSMQNDTLFRMYQELGHDGVRQLMNLMQQGLGANELQLLAAQQAQQQAAHQARAADMQRQQAVQVEEQRSRQEQYRAQVARAQADAANAQANAERERQARIAQEHEARMREQEFARETSRERAGSERAHMLEQAEVQRRNQQEAAERRERLEWERFQAQQNYEAEVRAEERELDRQAQEETIAREEAAQQARMVREAEERRQRLADEVQAEQAKQRAAAERDKELERFKVEQWNDPAARQAMQERQEDEARLKRQETLEKVNATIEGWKNAVFQFTDDPQRMRNVGKFVGGTVVVTAAGVLFFRHALPVVRQAVEEYLFTPPLIEETSYSRFGLFNRRNKNKYQKLENLYFDELLEKRKREMFLTLKNTKDHNGYYLNYLFYGPAGTGKTATARALAYESGMDFAFMTGGSVHDLLKTGKVIKRLREVFSWAEHCKKGLVLFIDEADAFLCDPNGDMSEELNAALKAFLNLTGTESKKVCVIMSTNHPNQLSKAVLSRVSYRQQIKFDVPGDAARKQMVLFFFEKYLMNNKAIQFDKDCLDKSIIDYIAERTQGFVGRDISYLLLGIEKAVLAKKKPVLTKKLIQAVVEEAVQAYNASQEFVSYA